MTERMEKISSFMDGEIQQDVDSVVRDLKTDPEAMKSWARYHLIGDAMRNELPGVPTTLYEDRLSSALASEPHHFSPRKVSTQKRASQWAGFAMAASVSAVAVFGIMQINSSEMGQSVPVQVAANTITIDTTTTNNSIVDFSASQIIAEPVMQVASADVIDITHPDHVASYDLESSMYDYLVNYSQYMVDTPIEGNDDSIRVVGLYTY